MTEKVEVVKLVHLLEDRRGREEGDSATTLGNLSGLPLESLEDRGGAAGS